MATVTENEEIETLDSERVNAVKVIDAAKGIIHVQGQTGQQSWVEDYNWPTVEKDEETVPCRIAYLMSLSMMKLDTATRLELSIKGCMFNGPNVRDMIRDRILDALKNGKDSKSVFRFDIELQEQDFIRERAARTKKSPEEQMLTKADKMSEEELAAFIEKLRQKQEG